MSPSAIESDQAVEFRDVSRSYEGSTGTIHALRDVTLSIGRGEIVAVTGPSGSGKTTLLNLMIGLDRPTAGEAITLGRSLNALRERQLTAFRAGSVGLVFQDPHLLPGLTALENVVVARLPWRSRRELVTEARALLVAVGLDARMDFPPAKLSGGERQRVGVARALLGSPPLLLADEPTGNLDDETTQDLVALLRELRERLSLTLVLATHDQTVSGAADRIVHLVGGTIRDGSDHNVAAVGLPSEAEVP
jgi:ABC-type lipoprotein export system ATPase subunit